VIDRLSFIQLSSCWTMLLEIVTECNECTNRVPPSFKRPVNYNTYLSDRTRGTQLLGNVCNRVVRVLRRRRRRRVVHKRFREVAAEQTRSAQEHVPPFGFSWSQPSQWHLSACASRDTCFRGFSDIRVFLSDRCVEQIAALRSSWQ